MSYRIPTVDLSTFPVNSIGQVKLNDVKNLAWYDPSTSSQVAHLRMFNESGSTLAIWSDDGSINDYIPAGAWAIYPLEWNTSIIYFKVLGILPTPPIQLLLVTYYRPGEEVPTTPTLGNSPIGIGGTVSTSGVTTLSNEGGASNTLVEDIGDAAFAQLYTLFTDGHGIWAVDQTGTKHQVIKVNTSGNPLQLGQAADNVEILGALVVDGNLFGTGGILQIAETLVNIAHALTVAGLAKFTATPAIQADTINSNASAGVDGVISVSGSGATQVTRLQSANSIGIQVPAGTNRITVDATNVGITENLNATSATFTGNIVTAQTGFTQGSFSRVVAKSGTGSGTFATGYAGGGNPFGSMMNCCTLSGSSQTLGATNLVNSVVTTGAALAWMVTYYG